VDVIVYVETHFLVSVAMGREGREDDLLAAVSASVRVAIPSGCYMESFSAFEDEQKRRNWFRAELEKQIVQFDCVRPVNRIFKARRRVVMMGPVRESPEAPLWLSRPAKSTGRRSSPISAARD
jgi:hypothetical protein